MERAVVSRRPKTSTAEVSSEPPELADRQACAAQAQGRRMGRAQLPGRPGAPVQRSVRPPRPACKARASRRLRRSLTGRASTGPRLRLGFRPSGAAASRFPWSTEPTGKEQP
jgi:hypothetical protein